MTVPTLKGRTAWLISDGKAGSDAQSVGIARALQLNYEIKKVSPRGIWKWLSPWLPPSPADAIGKPNSKFAPPWPAVVMAASRLSIPYLRAVRRAAAGKTYSVVLLDPRTGAGTADIIWVPQHDRLRGKNVITTLTPPHAFSPQRLAELRANLPPLLETLPRPFVMISLGGANKIYRYSEEVIERFEQALSALAAKGVSFLVTPSRRTPDNLIATAKRAIQNSPHIVWDGSGDNPYADFLAQADMLVVTADSISMTSEACATGKPVYIFEPEGGSAKFSRFHNALQEYGATRPLPVQIDALESWSYEPLYSTDEIATAIEQHWRAVLNG